MFNVIVILVIQADCKLYFTKSKKYFWSELQQTKTLPDGVEIEYPVKVRRNCALYKYATSNSAVHCVTV